MCDNNYDNEIDGYQDRIAELEASLEIETGNRVRVEQQANASADRVRFLNEANRAMSDECRYLMVEWGKTRAHNKEQLEKIERLTAENVQQISAAEYWMKKYSEADTEICALVEEIEEERGQRDTTRLERLTAENADLLARVTELEEDIDPNTGTYKQVAVLEQSLATYKTMYDDKDIQLDRTLAENGVLKRRVGDLATRLAANPPGECYDEDEHEKFSQRLTDLKSQLADLRRIDSIHRNEMNDLRIQKNRADDIIIDLVGAIKNAQEYVKRED